MHTSNHVDVTEGDFFVATRTTTVAAAAAAANAAPQASLHPCQNKESHSTNTVIQKLDLAKYHVSPTTGFVPTNPPPLTLLPTYFAPWDVLASRLPCLLQSHHPNALPEAVGDLPLLNAAKLGSLRELRRAYVVLGYLVHGFAWSGTDSGSGSGSGSGSEKEQVHIPRQLAQPYFEVCDRLGMQGRETLAYAGLCSWNWGFVNQTDQDGGGGIGEDDEDGKWEWRNLKCLVSFSGTRDEEVFYLVPVLVEKEAGAVVKALCEVSNLTQHRGDVETEEKAVVEKVKLVLHKLKQRLVKMQALMKLLHEECDPAVFWNKVRMYFAGGKGGPGWVFELGDGTKVRRLCVGGSAAQSATFPFLDAVLGIKHAKLGGDEISVFDEMREYMPVEQREFVAEVESRSSIAEFVKQRQHEGELVQVYNSVLQEMAKWRSKHIGAVTTHIVNQARKEKKQMVPSDEITDGLSVQDEGDLQGTGGSALIPFLKGARKDTEDATI